MRAAPTITTARLTLRAHRRDDFDAVAALWADPRVTRFILPQPATAEESWSRLLRYVGHWQMLGHGYWAITDTATGRFLGEAGIADYRRAMTPPLAVPEAGWVLAPDAQGKGLAGEAMTAILHWADRHLPAVGTSCIFDPGHERSIRLAGRLGYGQAVTGQYRGAPSLVLHRPAAGR